MAKAGRRGALKDGDPSRTRDRIVAAAIETLKREGFAGASARAIASLGGFNPALVFYHFGSVNDLLLAALDQTSRVRQERYRTALEAAHSLTDLVGVAREVFLEDLSSGHIKVLAEMIAGSSAVPELGPEVRARIAPWMQFTEDALARVLPSGPVADLVPRPTLAFAIVALYLGLEMLTELDGNRGPAESLFDSAHLATSLLGLLATPSEGIAHD